MVKVDQVAYGSIESTVSEGYQIIADSGTSTSVRNSVYDHSTLLKNTPPGYDFKNAMSTYRVPNDLIAVTYYLNGGEDYSGRPNSIYAHTLLIPSDEYQALCGNPFMLMDLMPQSANMKERDRLAKTGLGKVSIDQQIKEARQRFGEMGRSQLSDMSVEVESMLSEFNLSNKALCDVVQCLLLLSPTVIVAQDDASLNNLARMIIEFIPAQIRSQVTFHTLSMDPEVQIESHNLLITPESCYVRWFRDLPDEFRVLDTRTGSPRVKVVWGHYVEELAERLESSVYDALSFVKTVEQDLTGTAGSPNNWHKTLSEYMRGIMLGSEAEEEDQVSHHAAAMKYYEAAESLKDFPLLRKDMLFKGYSKVLMTLEVEKFLQFAEAITALSVSDSSVDFPETVKTIVSDALNEEQFRRLLLTGPQGKPGLLEMALKQPVELDNSTRTAMTKELLDQADFTLSGDLLQQFSEALSRSITDDVLADVAWKVVSDEGGFYQEQSIRTYTEYLIDHLLKMRDYRGLERLRACTDMEDLSTKISTSQLRLLSQEATTPKQWQEIINTVESLSAAPKSGQLRDAITDTLDVFIQRLGRSSADFQIQHDLIMAVLDSGFLVDPSEYVRAIIHQIVSVGKEQEIREYAIPIIEKALVTLPKDASEQLTEESLIEVLDRRQYELALGFIRTSVTTFEDRKLVLRLLSITKKLLDKVYELVRSHLRVSLDELVALSDAVADTARSDMEYLKVCVDIADKYLRIALYLHQTGISDVVAPAVKLQIACHEKTPEFVRSRLGKVLEEIEQPTRYLDFASSLLSVVDGQSFARPEWVESIHVRCAEMFLKDLSDGNWRLFQSALTCMSLDSSFYLLDAVGTCYLLKNGEISQATRRVEDMLRKHPPSRDSPAGRVAMNASNKVWTLFIDPSLLALLRTTQDVIEGPLITLSCWVAEIDSEFFDANLISHLPSILRALEEAPGGLVVWMKKLYDSRHFRTISIEKKQEATEIMLAWLGTIREADLLEHFLDVALEKHESLHPINSPLSAIESGCFDGQETQMKIAYLDTYSQARSQEIKSTEAVKERFLSLVEDFAETLVRKPEPEDMQRLAEMYLRIASPIESLNWLQNLSGKRGLKSEQRRVISSALISGFRDSKRDISPLMFDYLLAIENVADESVSAVSEYWMETKRYLELLPPDFYPDILQRIVESADSKDPSPLDKSKIQIAASLVSSAGKNNVALDSDLVCQVARSYSSVGSDDAMVQWFEDAVKSAGSDAIRSFSKAIEETFEETKDSRSVENSKTYLELFLMIPNDEKKFAEMYTALLESCLEAEYYLWAFHLLVETPEFSKFLTTKNRCKNLRSLVKGLRKGKLKPEEVSRICMEMVRIFDDDLYMPYQLDDPSRAVEVYMRLIEWVGKQSDILLKKYRNDAETMQRVSESFMHFLDYFIKLLVERHDEKGLKDLNKKSKDFADEWRNPLQEMLRVAKHSLEAAKSKEVERGS